VDKDFTNKLDGFGPLYIINLKRRTDRYERMMNIINNNNITDYTFIEAVDSQENIDHLIDNVENRHRAIPKDAEIATTISHIKAIHQIVSTQFLQKMICLMKQLSIGHGHGKNLSLV
jgi:GR25 family glycosyltransferase involved in LPS biosynthesis